MSVLTSAYLFIYLLRLSEMSVFLEVHVQSCDLGPLQWNFDEVH